jgi:hypothetical protein
LFSYYLREVVIPTLLSKILLYLPVDVAKLGEPCKFLCVSFLILSHPLPFILSGLHASILQVVSELGPGVSHDGESSECRTKGGGPPNHDVIHGSALLDRRCAPDASWTCPDPNMVKRS